MFIQYSFFYTKNQTGSDSYFEVQSMMSAKI